MKNEKCSPPLLVTICNIGYADALMSVLSLQTAMFSSFGEDSNLDPTRMNGINAPATVNIPEPTAPEIANSNGSTIVSKHGNTILH